MKIYTKTGDAGKTLSYDQTPTSKSSPRIQVIGAIDELNSWLGLIIAQLDDKELSSNVIDVQNDLFQLGSYLSGKEESQLTEQQVIRLENQIDQWDQKLEPLMAFILPGGSLCAAHVHIARTVCRRAERELVKYHDVELVMATSLQYLNRLSDWLFVLARYINVQSNTPEILWRSKQ